MDVSIVRRTLSPGRSSLWVKSVSLRVETKIDCGLVFLQLLATGMVNGFSSVQL